MGGCKGPQAVPAQRIAGARQMCERGGCGARAARGRREGVQAVVGQFVSSALPLVKVCVYVCVLRLSGFDSSRNSAGAGICSILLLATFGSFPLHSLVPGACATGAMCVHCQARRGARAARPHRARRASENVLLGTAFVTGPRGTASPLLGRYMCGLVWARGALICGYRRPRPSCGADSRPFGNAWVTWLVCHV